MPKNAGAEARESGRQEGQGIGKPIAKRGCRGSGESLESRSIQSTSIPTAHDQKGDPKKRGPKF